MKELNVRQEPNDNGTSSDGIRMFVVNGFRIPLSHMEFKKELGDGASDPLTQVGLSMKRAWIQKDVGLTLYFLIFNLLYIRLAKRNTREVLLPYLASRWSLVGCAQGDVFTNKVIVQRLTDVMWCATIVQRKKTLESTVWHEFWLSFVVLSMT